MADAESKQECVALDMPNGIESKINYKQQFVQARNPYEGAPKPNAAKRAPSLEEAMKGIDRD